MKKKPIAALKEITMGCIRELAKHDPAAADKRRDELAMLLSQIPLADRLNVGA